MEPKKKLSGAENLKKKIKRELEFKKGANALSKFLQKNEESILHTTSSEQDKVKQLDNMDISIEPSIKSDPATWPSLLTSKQIDYIVVTGPEIFTEFSSIQLDHEKRHFSKIHFYRHLSNGEKLVRRWLIYSKSTGKIFC